MALGAAFAGHLGVTTTSGPGLMLKSETISLAISVELPLLIVDIQRGGPSTGADPTEPSAGRPWPRRMARWRRLLGAALKAIEQAKAPFVSRGDNSGTHNLEKSLWKAAGVQPSGSWYIESGQGMGATLGIAQERNAYTVTDRGTYLALQRRVTLPILVEGDRTLLNIYSVLEVNPANGPRVNAVGGKAFADFMVSDQAQKLIKSFGLEKFGQSLFVPVAGKREEELGG